MVKKQKNSHCYFTTFVWLGKEGIFMQNAGVHLWDIFAFRVRARLAQLPVFQYNIVNITFAPNKN